MNIKYIKESKNFVEEETPLGKVSFHLHYIVFVLMLKFGKCGITTAIIQKHFHAFLHLHM